MAKRLAVYGLDKIYASTSNRAMQTVQPTCEMLKMEMETVDFANEKYSWEDITIETEEYGKTWGVKRKKLMELVGWAVCPLRLWYGFFELYFRYSIPYAYKAF